jgi:hypothetical protein
MSTEITQFEARAYKRLYELYRMTLGTITTRAINCVEYALDKPEDVKKLMQYIADRSKWDYCGIECKQTTIAINELEKCLQP